MKRYHINKTLIRDQVHRLDLMISEKALRGLEDLMARAVVKICMSAAGDDRKIVKARDLKALVPYVQVTFGPRKSAPGTKQPKKRKDPTIAQVAGILGKDIIEESEKHGKTEETYITA